MASRTAMETGASHGKGNPNDSTGGDAFAPLLPEGTNHLSGSNGGDEAAAAATPNRTRRGVIVLLLALIAVVAVAASVAAIAGFAAEAAHASVYFTLLLGTAALAYRMKDRGVGARWVGGFACATIMSVYKTKVLMALLLLRARGGEGGGGEVGEESGGTAVRAIVIVFYGFTALWESSNATLVFGGDPLLQRLGIASYRRALVAGLAPCQVKFSVYAADDEERRVMNAARTSRRSLHLALFILGGFFLRQALRMGDGPRATTTGAVTAVAAAASAVLADVARLVRGSPILETEALALLVSSFVVAVFDTPAHVWQIATNSLSRFLPREEHGTDCSTSKVGGGGGTITRVEAILPYGAVYFCTSSRDFWSKWSRPATRLIRQMVYHPLGGSRYPYISVPLLFAINGACHYDVGHALIGDRAEASWNVVFGVLGLAATCEVLATNVMAAARQGGGSFPLSTEARRGLPPPPPLPPLAPPPVAVLPLWFRIVRGVAAHASIRVALYVFVHRCLKADVWSLFVRAA